MTVVWCADCRDRGERRPGRLGVLRTRGGVLHWTAEDKDWARLMRRRNPSGMWPGKWRFRGVVADDVRERLPVYCNKCNAAGVIRSSDICQTFGTVWLHMNRARV